MTTMIFNNDDKNITDNKKIQRTIKKIIASTRTKTTTMISTRRTTATRASTRIKDDKNNSDINKENNASAERVFPSGFHLGIAGPDTIFLLPTSVVNEMSLRLPKV